MQYTRFLLPLLIGFGVVLLGMEPLHAASERGEDTCAIVYDDPDPPEYYQIDLVTTKKLPGSRLATGVGNVTFAASPFGIAISPNGNYVYRLDIEIEKLRPATEGTYVAWVSTSNLDQIKPLGALDEQMQVSGEVAWNKFLVIITLEPSADDLGDIWQGPIVLRGLSRSGLMHTMAGHGPFQQEPCATYGYN